MVKIINYKRRESADGEFFVLEVSGGIEMVKSKATGMYYATAKKATVTSTFDEETCISLIGMEMPGRIEKVECEPYEYTLQETGEVLVLSHRNSYVPDDVGVPAKEKAFAMAD